MAKPIPGNGMRRPLAQEITARLAELATNDNLTHWDQVDLITRLDAEVFADAPVAGKGGSRGFFGNLPRQIAEDLQSAAERLLDRSDLLPDLRERLDKVVNTCAEIVRIRRLQSEVWRTKNLSPSEPDERVDD